MCGMPNSAPTISHGNSACDWSHECDLFSATSLGWWSVMDVIKNMYLCTYIEVQLSIHPLLDHVTVYKCKIKNQGDIGTEK